MRLKRDGKEQCLRRLKMPLIKLEGKTGDISMRDSKQLSVKTLVDNLGLSKSFYVVIVILQSKPTYFEQI